ncbi:MAG: RNA methyltransferase [Lachnospiraceae bacterium]|nr:RNA methyltransferase [Agathobacter sp.]MDD6445705.1 RNA methyltransferase [Lachnospiraceae bacterium]MDY4892443.1 RNA methyltransferase [Agathobacter sp.]
MITSTANQQMKHLSALMKKSRERKKEGAFVVEGIKMFREATKTSVISVYVSESFLHQNENRKLLEEYSYEILQDSVFRAVSDTQTPQGILAVVRMPKYELKNLLKGDKTHLLILDSIQDPGNLGTMVRTGEGAGVTGIIMNRTTVDLFNPKTIRSTMGSIYRMPYLISDDLPALMERLKEKKVTLYAAHLKGNESYDSFDYTKASGFLIGNEGNGLSEEVASKADFYLKIPMEGQVESLNAAVSAALLTYECSRQRRKKYESMV